MKREHTALIVCLLLLVAALASVSTAAAQEMGNVTDFKIGDDMLEFRLTEGDAPNKAYLMRIYHESGNQEARYADMERTLNEKLEQYSGGRYSLSDTVERRSRPDWVYTYEDFSENLSHPMHVIAGGGGWISSLSVLQYETDNNYAELDEGSSLYIIGGDIEGSVGTEIELDEFVLNEDENLVVYPNVASLESTFEDRTGKRDYTYKFEVEADSEVEVKRQRIPLYPQGSYEVDYVGVAGPHEFEEGLRLNLAVEIPPQWTTYTSLSILVFLIMTAVLFRKLPESKTRQGDDSRDK